MQGRKRNKIKVEEEWRDTRKEAEQDKGWRRKIEDSRAVDQDLHGYAFIFPPESGSAFNKRIRIQEGKILGEMQKKCKVNGRKL